MISEASCTWFMISFINSENNSLVMATSSSKNLKASSFGTNSGNAGNKVTAKTAATSDAGEGVGVIPIIRSKDNAKQLPTYLAALQRPADEYLAAEDLDNIQLELETLLSNVALRYRVLKSEYESIDKDDRRRAKPNCAAVNSDKPVSPATTAAVTTASEKRKRDDNTSRKSKHTSTSTLKHSKHAKHSPMADDTVDYGGKQGRDYHMQKMALPKNDIPNKFWLSVEPYCMPLTNEDLRLLDDLLEQYTGPLIPPIPELGAHYSNVWAVEDLKEIQQNSNVNQNLNRQKSQNSDVCAMLKKADSMIDECVTGPLTQRLVSALMEEQLVQNSGDFVTGAGVGDSSNSSCENAHLSAQLNFRSLALLRNGIGIEKRVKKELIEQGVLDMSDFPNDDEDEIHSEIKRLISELSSVAEYNSTALKRLREAAAEEIKRLEIKRKLDVIDQEILETYKRTIQNKAKRKPMTAEEQQEIFRLTAEQKALSDQLERLQINCQLFNDSQ